jgi:hypothetical protein
MTFVIGLDLDGVCYNFVRTANYMLRKRISDRGEAIPEVLTRDWNYWHEIEEKISTEDFMWLWTDAAGAGLFRYGHVINGAIEGVRDLSTFGDVVAITHRPKAAVHDTLAWLTFMFDQSPLAGVVIQSHGQKKSEVLPTPDVYIDDAIHVAEEILDNIESDVVLFDQPWNQDYPGNDRLTRAKGWGDVIEAVSRIRDEAYYAGV